MASEREIVEVLATKVMGWRPASRNTRSFADLDKEIVRPNFWWQAPDGARVEQTKWNPLESWADAGMLIEALPKDFGLRVQRYPLDWVAHITLNGQDVGYGSADTGPRAINTAFYEWAQADCPPSGYPTDENRCVECPRAAWNAKESE